MLRPTQGPTAPPIRSVPLPPPHWQPYWRACPLHPRRVNLTCEAEQVRDAQRFAQGLPPYGRRAAERMRTAARTPTVQSTGAAHLCRHGTWEP
uniref:Uncharacterized protein n=1 Tax=Plectus sambesii TaxID=2011161 RepID=A0A914WS48_9BILA